MASPNILSFREWVRQNPSIPFNQRNRFYEAHLRSVQEETISEAQPTNEIRASYIAFLKRLIVFYNDDPEIRQLENIDFDSELQLRAAMPIFARKLQDIALFANQRRRELKNKKFELSTKGSELGLKSSLRSFLIENYSQSDNYINPEINDLQILENLLTSKELAENLKIVCVEKYNNC